MFDDDTNLDWFVRENEEIDEKLPMMAKDVMQRGIDYKQLDGDEEPDPDVVIALIEVLRDNLYSFDQMTHEEVTHAVQQLLLASILVECVEEGALEEVDGKYMCSEKSRI